MSKGNILSGIGGAAAGSAIVAASTMGGGADWHKIAIEACMNPATEVVRQHAGDAPDSIKGKLVVRDEAGEIERIVYLTWAGADSVAVEVSDKDGERFEGIPATTDITDCMAARAPSE